MRRSKWKNLYLNIKNFDNLKKTKTPVAVPRNCAIVPKFLNLTVKTHTGKTFKKILITEDIIGHKFGEFAKTRAEFIFKKKKKKT